MESPMLVPTSSCSLIPHASTMYTDSIQLSMEDAAKHDDYALT